MASISDNGRLMIRKRAAPNIRQKKTNLDSQSNQNLKVESVPLISNVIPSSTSDNKPPISTNSEIKDVKSTFTNQPSLPDDASTSIESELLLSNITHEKTTDVTVDQPNHGEESDLPTVPKNQSSGVLDVASSDKQTNQDEIARVHQDNNLAVDTNVSASTNDVTLKSSSIVSIGKLLKKRSVPILPKRRAQPSLPDSISNSASTESILEQDIELNDEVGNNKISLDPTKNCTVSINDATSSAEVETNTDKLGVSDSVLNDSCAKLTALGETVQTSDSVNKVALKKRATPILCRKRPLPNPILCSSTNKDSQKSLVDTIKDEQKSDSNAENVSLVDSSKLSEISLPQNQSLENQKSELLSQHSISISNEQQNELLEGNTQPFNQNSYGESEIPVKKVKFEDTTGLSEPHSETKDSSNSISDKNKLEKISKEPQIKSSNNKFIKRRVGPKLKSAIVVKPGTLIESDINAASLKSLSANIQPSVKTCSNSVDVKDGPVEFPSSEGSDNTSVISPAGKCDSSQKSTDQVFDNKSQTGTVGQCPSEITNASNKQEAAGVVRIFLNHWPQQPLNNLTDDPFFQGKNIKELGNMCIFSKNKNRIAYYDTKSPVNFKNVPNNWALINFNKIIKDNNEKSQPSTNEITETSEKDNVCTSESEEQAKSKNLTISVNENEKVDSLKTAKQLLETKLNDDTDVLSGSGEKVIAVVNESSVNENNLSQCHILSELDTSLPACSGTDNLEEGNDPLLKDKGDTEDKNDDSKSTALNKSSNQCEAEQFEDSAVNKPYKLRKAKPLSVKNYEDVELDDVNRVEDIFSNSEDSDVSEFDGGIDSGFKSKKSLKNMTKCVRKRQKKFPKVTKKKVLKKETIKKEKPKKSADNISSFCKLQNQVKNKKKWDEDGNCEEPEKLELKDFIFYVPKNEPMSQGKKEVKTVLKGIEEKEKEEEKEDEENHGPKLIVKDGKIVVDPNSTKIKQTPVMQFKAEKWERPKEVNDPWELQETMKFYASLWKYGIDYSVLAGSFPKKSRDSLKKKFSYEEKCNGSLLGKTLTKKLTLEAVLREVILIDSLDKLSRKKKSSEDCGKKTEKPSKKQPKHCLLQKRKKPNRNDANRNSKQIKTEHFVSQNYYNEGDSQQQWPEENEVTVSEEVNTINLNDVITFSTNVVYKNMNIVESVSFHPSAIQPVDINVTICHEPQPTPVTEDTALK